MEKNVPSLGSFVMKQNVPPLLLLCDGTKCSITLFRGDGTNVPSFGSLVMEQISHHFVPL